jgi:hypothetical protein
MFGGFHRPQMIHGCSASKPFLLTKFGFHAFQIFHQRLCLARRLGLEASDKTAMDWDRGLIAERAHGVLTYSSPSASLMSPAARRP